MQRSPFLGHETSPRRNRLLLIGCIICLLTATLGMYQSGAAPVAMAAQADPGKFLTGPQQGTPLDIAWAYIRGNQKAWGYSADDFADTMITDQYTDADTGTTHIYMRQRFDGIQVHMANLGIHIARNGSIITVDNNFVVNGRGLLNSKSPAIQAPRAAELAAANLGLKQTEAFGVQNAVSTADQFTLLGDGGVARQAIPAKLMYVKAGKGLQLVWDLELDSASSADYWSLRIDAMTGAFVDKINYTIHEDFFAQAEEAHGTLPASAAELNTQRAPEQVGGGSYNVYQLPVESPSHGSRSVVNDPATSNASPYGWHDTNGAAGAEYTITRGNNVYAYTDTDANNSPDSGSAPDGTSSLNFNFPLDLTQAPSAYRPAAVTNLFYMNNMMHDIIYNYGFTEAAGNFQTNNYGKGGTGNDAVNAEAQDGSGTNNANFSTPTDGGAGRMQMYTWTAPNPDRDGDFDNGIIAHEYGHGISIRLTGGPANSSCLNNSEQAGEGWSDFFAVMLTAKSSDTATTSRPMGTYALNQPTTGVGIRAYPYNTSMSVDPRTYNSIKTAAIPHGVGSTWTAMLWELNWGMIAQYGFDGNLYTGTGGNNRTLRLVVEGLKLQPCSPGFVQSRNAILQADTNLYGGANQCIIWKAFAKRGLGYSANQGSSSSATDGTEAFDLPAACSGTSTPTPVPPTNTPTTGPTSTPLPPTNTPTTGPTSTPVPPTNTPVPTATTTPGGNAIVNGGFESGASPWVQASSGGYTIVDTTRPHAGSYSAYMGGYNSATESIYQTVVVPTNGTLKYWWYNTTTESGSTAWDYLRVRIYNTSGTLLGTVRTWSNASTKNTWSQDSVSLAAYAGQTVRVRFEVTTDSSLTTSFFVDDVSLTGTSLAVTAPAADLAPEQSLKPKNF